MDGEMTPLGMASTQRYAEQAAQDLMVSQNDRVTIEKLRNGIAELTADREALRKELERLRDLVGEVDAEIIDKLLEETK